MPEYPVTLDVALAFIRGLSGAPGYPFHEEGEARAASILRDCSISVEHARAIMEEFEADFPTIQQIRATAYRLRPKFDPKARAEEDENRKREAQERAALKGLHQSVPLIPGVRWEICLQIQCLRIATQEERLDPGFYQKALVEFPEAMADIRAGLDPDPAVVETRYRALHPAWRPAGMSALSALENIVGKSA